MATIPSQYRNFQTPPVKELANLSSLQLALLHYMREGQEVPFFINHDWLRALTTFADSGIVRPTTVGGFGPVIVKGNVIYTIEPKPDCGPDDTDRYEEVYRGTITNQSEYWTGSFDQVIRGGSAADGAGGIWATGGLNGPDTSPGNGENLPPPIYSNSVTEYGAPITQANSVTVLACNIQANIALNGRTEVNGQPALSETQIVQEMFNGNVAVYVQGVA